ncbi:MAG: deoxyribonuclease IV [Eubacterium sp.]|nr:deoxyribonuclease IV [Eubacterium sp.]
MLVLGPHISIAKGFKAAGCEALKVNANTFQFFTRNPRGGNAKALDFEDIAGLREIMAENNFGPLLAHAPYTLNMASNKAETRDFAKRAFKEDLERLKVIPCHLYNFHPGSHVGQGSDKGIDLIVEILNECIAEDQKTIVLLEAMAGKGSEVGFDFAELRAIIDGVELSDKLGVCMDTCHVYSAGYDIKADLDGVLETFDSIVGLDRLKALHLNDSMTPFGSHKDRHEKLGFGSIGIDTFVNIVRHPALRDKPMFLETPQEKFLDYKKEIDLLKEAAQS